VLQHAVKAVYTKDVIQPVPAQMRTRYLMKGKGSQAGYYRVVPELRSMVTFRHLNLVAGEFSFGSRMDIVFCRNVIIYFDRPTQTDLFARIYRKMSPGGYLFLGHAESLQGIENDFAWIAPTIYRKPARAEN
jgi:chemotaxis protein methyltransferase CheR